MKRSEQTKAPASMPVEKAAKYESGRRKTRSKSVAIQPIDQIKTKSCDVPLKKLKMNSETIEGVGLHVQTRRGDAEKKIQSQNNARSSFRIVNEASNIVQNSGNLRKTKVCLRKVNLTGVSHSVKEQKKNLLTETAARSHLGSILEPFLKSPERAVGASKTVRNFESRLSLTNKRGRNANITAANSSTSSDSTKPSPGNQTFESSTSPPVIDQGISSSVSSSEQAMRQPNNLNNYSPESHAKDESVQVISTDTKNTASNFNTTSKKVTSRKMKRCAVQVCRITRSKALGLVAMQEKPETLPKVSQNIEKSGKSIFKKNSTQQSEHQSPPPTCTSPDIFSDVEENNGPDIYAFNTQSSQSEREDVAADIIQKMKREGKIKLMRPRNKHAKKSTKRNMTQPANWRAIAKDLSVANPSVMVRKTKKTIADTTHKKADEVMSTKYGKNDDFLDDGHFDDSIDLPEDEATTLNVSIAKTAVPKSSGFSALAQNVLRKETAKKTPMKPSKLVDEKNHNLSKGQLLEIARKIVNDSNIRHSTPNKPSASAISAGRRSNTSPSVGSSPWRVSSGSVPQLFYFARTSDNLPSYSSDVIPSSQQSNKSEEKRDKPNKSVTIVSPTKLLDGSLNISSIPNVSPIKSRSHSSLNISNIENISPIRPIEEKTKDTSVLFGANPRRGLVARSPLKPINILNVVTLPNRVTTQQIKEKTNPAKENLPEKIVTQENSSNQTTNSSFDNNTLKGTSTASDFFGFNDENVIDDELMMQPLQKATLPNKKRLQNKLIKLKRLLPPKPTRISCETIRSIFKSPKKQPNIREMLSSTRNKSTVEHVTETSVLNNSSSDEASSFAMDDNDSTNVDNDLHLFDDPADPRPSFNASIKIRTYERPKRKVKKVRSFVMFKSDSESDEELAPAKTKRRKPDKNKKELTKFIDEFNSMCEEVDNYDLVVEKGMASKPNC